MSVEQIIQMESQLHEIATHSQTQGPYAGTTAEGEDLHVWVETVDLLWRGGPRPPPPGVEEAQSTDG
eukprot:6917547-Pyramimonas_sp.AAC.2